MTDTTTAAAIAPKAYGAYALNKCLIGDGVINGVLNAGIFYLMHMADTGATFGLTDVLVDFAMTGLLLGIILAAIVIPLTRKDRDKGVFAVPRDGSCGIGAHLPRNAVGAAICVGLVGLVVMPAAGALVCLALPMPLGFVSMMVLKGCLCAAFGALAGYLSIGKVAAEGK